MPKSDAAVPRPLLGQVGEMLAAEYLIRRGYVMVERNYRCAAGEIDLVARDGRTLVFVEVRSRSSPDYGMPLEQIDFRKQCRLRRVAAFYLGERKSRCEALRFDAVGVLFREGEEPDIQHVIDAFRRGVT